MTTSNSTGDPSDTVPRCDTCGAEVSTSFMAFICPRREQCEFWPDDEGSQALIRESGWVCHEGEN